MSEFLCSYDFFRCCESERWKIVDLNVVVVGGDLFVCGENVVGWVCVIGVVKKMDCLAGSGVGVGC